MQILIYIFIATLFITAIGAGVIALDLIRNNP